MDPPDPLDLGSSAPSCSLNRKVLPRIINFFPKKKSLRFRLHEGARSAGPPLDLGSVSSSPGWALHTQQRWLLGCALIGWGTHLGSLGSSAAA